MVHSVGRVLSLFKGFETLSISFESPRIKSDFLFSTVDEILSKGEQVYYLDSDLVFSCYLASRGKFYPKDNFQLYSISKEDPLKAIISLLSSLDYSQGGAVVVDTINSLQMIFTEFEKRGSSSKANHEASILLTLLQQFSRNQSKTLILSSIAILHPRTNSKAEWEKDVAGGRMIRRKSEAILSVTELNQLDSNERKLVQISVDAISAESATQIRQGESFNMQIPPYTL